MSKRTVIGSSVMVITLVSMILIYKSKESEFANRLPMCFPTGEKYPYKDVNGNIKDDSVNHAIAGFKLTDQNGNTITNQPIKNNPR